MPTEPPHRTIILFKPYDVLSSFTDEEGRRTLAELVPVPGVYAAGRLDQDSEGLLVLTDDGELAHRLTHPRYKLPKTYLAQVEGTPDAEALRRLRAGVTVKGEMTAPAEVELLAGEPPLPPRSVSIRERANIPTSWLRIVLREGKKRQVRHMTAAVGYPTLRLVRIAVGPLALGELQPGEWRDLTTDELVRLNHLLHRRGAPLRGSSSEGAEGLQHQKTPRAQRLRGEPHSRSTHDRFQDTTARPRAPHRVRPGHPFPRRRRDPGAGRV
jgi:23S rRNA pseudouridine2457 synthase